MVNFSIREELREKKFRVAIFGSARITPQDGVYQDVRSIARALTKRGMGVVTGGGPGLMEAAVLGHEDAGNEGTHAIGLNIKLPHEQRANRHLDVKADFERFSDRLDYFMALSNAVVVAPGGVGTLLELAYTWQLVQVKHVCHIPVILYGRMWKDFVKWVRKWPLKSKYLDEQDVQLLYHCTRKEAALEVIDEAFAAYRKGGKNFCLNFEKYRVA